MKICVLGRGHLGSVTAACLASLGHQVAGFDTDTPPITGEPGLDELLRQGINAGTLTFSDDLKAALKDAGAVWVAYDTPIDDDDGGDAGAVMASVASAFPYVENGATILVSSQLPVGSTRAIQEQWHAAANGRTVTFVYSPENLQVGKAIHSFLSPDRIIVGADSRPAAGVVELLGPLADRVLWMTIESAEMSKHALNAFLATSVAFINELSSLCERTGADAQQVERALKTDGRIGARAYLAPGAAFAGGTLARDVEYLRAIGKQQQQPTSLLDGLAASNTEHRNWPLARLSEALHKLKGRRIAVWGLAYKPNTAIVRRSDAIRLCNTLCAAGATVVAHDPSLSDRPKGLDAGIFVTSTSLEAIAGADALVVATPWPEYRTVNLDTLLAALKQPLVIDANRHLLLDRRFRHVSVGGAHDVT